MDHYSFCVDYYKTSGLPDIYINLSQVGLAQNRSRTNLSHIDEADDTDSAILSTGLLKNKRKSMQEKSSTASPSLSATRAAPRLSLPRLDAPRISISAPRLSLTIRDPLLDAQHRSIEIDKLEKYILGKKSVELEIEFGIARSQLCR